MAVRHYMLSENSQVESVFIEFSKVFLCLKTHIDSMGIVFNVLIRDTPCRSKQES